MSVCLACMFVLVLCFCLHAFNVYVYFVVFMCGGFCVFALRCVRVWWSLCICISLCSCVVEFVCLPSLTETALTREHGRHS